MDSDRTHTFNFEVNTQESFCPHLNSWGNIPTIGIIINHLCSSKCQNLTLNDPSQTKDENILLRREQSWIFIFDGSFFISQMLRFWRDWVVPSIYSSFCVTVEILLVPLVFLSHVINLICFFQGQEHRVISIATTMTNKNDLLGFYVQPMSWANPLLRITVSYLFHDTMLS